jgi:hypothetical protein
MSQVRDAASHLSYRYLVLPLLSPYLPEFDRQTVLA